MEEALSARMAAVAVNQHALITLDQLRELKVTRRQRERLLTTGQIVRVAKDVYRLNGARPAGKAASPPPN